MINAEKTQLLAKTALYEKNEGREALSLQRLFADRNQFFAFFRYVPFGFSLYLLVLFLVVAGNRYAQEDGLYLFQRGPAAIAVIILCGIVFTAVYALICYTASRRKFRNIRSSMRTYNLDIRRIEEIEIQEAEDSEI